MSDSEAVSGTGSPTVEEQCAEPKMETDQADHPRRKKSKPFTVNVEIDFMQLGLFIVTLVTRTWKLGVPWAVVFDELHFAKFISLYLQRIFFFDVHPPLGKLILAVAGGYTGFEGDIDFERIGAAYSSNFPVQQLRLVPAICGSLVVPIVYQICVELHFSRWVALLAGAFIMLDNALLVQSRFMLLEGMLLFFMSLALLSFLRFRNLNHREFSLQWWFWLCSSGLSFAACLSVKYVGFFTAILIVYLAIRDYWKMLAEYTRTDMNLVKHMLARFLFLLLVPVCVYVYVFYIHLSLLTKAGPHDNVMTSAFQASLEGGLATLTQGQPLYVAYGSQITLRQTFDPQPGKPCWLHSHPYMYPVRYPDGRGSSHQQQVTCYVFKDINNWWIVKHPEREEMVVSDPPEPVKDGDIVQLVHGVTSRALNSHDVAAPLSPQLQEVSCYINYNVSMEAENLWRVEILNKDSRHNRWETIKSQVRLVHISTKQVLKMSGQQLPEWGFNQLEVATDRIIQQNAAVWNVEEHRYTRSGDKSKQMEELAAAEMIPLKPTHLSFWDKFWELQFKMLLGGSDGEMEHKYSSSPLDWPLMSKNVAYWMSGASNAQIHLLGNVVVWTTGTLAIVCYILLIAWYLLRRQRKCMDLTEDEWEQFLFVGELFVVGYLLHFLPYFLTDRTLFLHHYLPCVVYKTLALAALVGHLEQILNRVHYGPMMLNYFLLALLTSASWVFWKLSIISYGCVDLTKEHTEDLQWKESWDFLLHNV